MKESHKLEELIGRYLDGTLHEAGAAELFAMLENDASALRLFCDNVTTEASMRYLGREDSSGCCLFGHSVASGNIRSSWGLAVATSVAVLAVIATVLWFVRVRPAEPFATLQSSPHSLYQISEPPNGNTEDDPIRQGSTIRVKQGVVELRLRNGVFCSLQAPAELCIHRADFVSLEEGLARFEVGPEARGFRVRSPLLEVEDLGTVFGVDCRDSEVPVVHLLEGSAEVRALTGRKESMTLASRQSAALRAAGTLERVDPAPNLFPGKLPSGLQGAYFSFDGLKSGDGVMRGAGSLAEREQIRFTFEGRQAPRPGVGRSGGGLELTGGDGRAVSNWRSIGGSKRRSIAFWMRTASRGEGVSGKPTAMRILGYGLYRGGFGMANFSLRLSNDQAEQKLVLYAGRRYLEGTTILNDGEWHHVAVVIGEPSGEDWPNTEIYIDGVREVVNAKTESWVRREIEDFNTRTTHPLATPLTLGQYNPTFRQGAFEGVIDELFIVEGMLSAEQVRALYELRHTEAGIDLGH